MLMLVPQREVAMKKPIRKADLLSPSYLRSEIRDLEGGQISKVARSGEWTPDESLTNPGAHGRQLVK